MKAGLIFACMNLKKLAKILVMRNRKLLSFIYRIEFLLNKINAREKVVPGLTVKHHFVYSLRMCECNVEEVQYE